MVLILDCKSDKSAHVTYYLCCLICLGYLIKSSAATNRIFFLLQNDQFFIYACAFATSNQVPWSKVGNRYTKQIIHIVINRFFALIQGRMQGVGAALPQNFLGNAPFPEIKQGGG